MRFKKALILLSVFTILPISAQDRYASNISYDKRHAALDSVILRQLMEDEDERGDIYEGLYENWSNTKVDPYGINLKNMKDSFAIDCSGYYPPCLGSVTSPFGPRWRHFHNGIDLRVRVGDTIRAAFSGRVRVRRYNSGGYGYFLVLRHKDGLETVYGHLSKFLVAPNQRVRAGDPIALGGNTGHSTGPHLHFEVRIVGNPINPAKLFSFTDYLPLRNRYYVVKNRTFEERLRFQGDYSVHSSRSTDYSRISFYTVRRGDVLSKIADRNGLSVSKLCKLNNITPSSRIRPGQRLRMS